MENRYAPGTGSRSAAIGGTREARIEGSTAAIHVVRTPITSETTTVRGRNCVVELGSSNPTAFMSPWSPLAITSPNASPIPDATRPTTTASAITERRTWFGVAPSVRSSASSRVRCATRIEKVL